MIPYTTAESLFHLANQIMEAPTNEHFIEFSQTLQSWNDHFQDFVFVFRVLHYVRAKLYIMQSSDNERLHRLQILISYIDTELELLIRYGGQSKQPTNRFRWTGSLIELIEIVYALNEIGCINDGQNDIKDLAAFFGSQFGLEIKSRNCYEAYVDIKRRKNDSRTYFLDKMRERLNLRMQRDDEKEMQRRR